MNNIKAIGTSMLLLALIGLSGCDKNGTTVVPAAANTTENTAAVDGANSDQQADTVPQPAIASSNLPVESQTASGDASVDENASNDETAAPEGSSASDAAGALTYRAIPIANSAHAMTNNGRNLVYGTVDGLIYSLNPNTGNSTFLYDVNTHIPDILIGGLAYIGGSQYYYSAAHASTINRLDIESGTSEEIAGGLFPDGIDLYHNKIYSVTDDRSEVLTV
ncbi:MAG TPA: hypothetical protein ENK72_01825, partial [Epsilonproteobacteria bacterium]|nr:hypothetical protein [Campylobacterota bacterium]